MPNSEQLTAQNKTKSATLASPSVKDINSEIVQLVTGGKKILQELKTKVPPTLFSVDKEKFIGAHIIQKMRKNYGTN